MKWEEKYNLFAYSVLENSALCTICITFSKWTKPFQKLKLLRLEECCQREVWNHTESQLQSRATEALRLCWSFSNYCTRVTEKYECREAHNKKVSRNGKAHCSILELESLWQRGTNLCKAIGQEKVRMVKIDDFLQWKSWFDDELKHHFKIEPANAKYVSPSIQNG